MYAGVIIDITNEALDRVFTYRIPEGMEVHTGDRVSIPFGRLKKPKSGYVVTISEQCDLDEALVKELFCVEHGAISVKEQLIALAAWMAQEYGATMNQCLKTVLPVRRAVGKSARRIDPLAMYADVQDEKPVLNEEQTQAFLSVQAALARAFPAAASEECGEKADAKEDASPKETEVSESVCAAGDAAFVGADLQKNSGERAERLLLYGITGSGKTEVYMAAMAEAIRRGRQVIMLIPEISLTYQTVRRISARFRERVAILHSRMSAGERYEQYMRCEKGQVDILIGPRSAVFAPFDRLGLIIMDEEHEGAYKSEVAPRYQTRDVAAKRAALARCPILYGSATPSMEIYREALAGDVALLTLKKRARAGSALAQIETVDLRRELEEGNRSIFSRRLAELIADRLEKREQTILFINRRGYANFVSCRSCGEAVRCPHCDVSLTLHADGVLRCHYCGYEQDMMRTCPACGSPYIAPFGTGTQKLEQLTRQAFPQARVLRMDADTTRRKGGHEAILAAFRAHEADILIGTQMIVKGHDFPKVTLVGIIAADLSLCAPDYRSAERTFQLLTQAAGRAGRAAAQGNVVIQSYQPDHYAITFAQAQDYSGFYEEELVFRRMLGYPPTERMLTIQASAGDEDFLESVVQAACTAFSAEANAVKAELLGPMNATVYKVNDIFRKIIYIRHPSHAIILRLRDAYAAQIRARDRRGLIQLAYDLD